MIKKLNAYAMAAINRFFADINKLSQVVVDRDSYPGAIPAKLKIDYGEVVPEVFDMQGFEDLGVTEQSGMVFLYPVFAKLLRRGLFFSYLYSAIGKYFLCRFFIA